MKRVIVFICIIVFITNFLIAQDKLLIYMDDSQTDHLRAYGLTYWCLSHGLKAEWLLNYRNGSFIIPDASKIREEASILGVSYEPISSGQHQQILMEIDQRNMERIFLDKAPKIAVYIPPTFEPWDDAVTLVLEYVKISYSTLWDEEVFAGELTKYDWLHMHHEDFTGQYGKFYASFRNHKWYKDRITKYKQMAHRLGYKSVQEEKSAVAKLIQAYTADGGFLFSMCSACDTIDISIAADGLDIVAPQIDGTPLTPNFQQKLDFTKTFAFENFNLISNPSVYEFSDIDIDIMKSGLYRSPDSFILFEFSAKQDSIPCMLTQNHINRIKGFLGQTTAFNKNVIKDTVTIMGETPGTTHVKYIHGDFGKGTYTFLGGHDPEDYQHLVGDPPTDLSLHKNSPGYRLILNNILFPAARKKERKT